MLNGNFLGLLGQLDNGGEAAAGAAAIIFVLVYLVLIVGMIASMWKLHTKAGQPGWAVLVPFYNTYIFVKIAGRPDSWFLFCLIPFVNIIFLCILCIDVAKKFGKDVGFGIGIILLGFIFIPILAFGSAQYQGGNLANTFE